MVVKVATLSLAEGTDVDDLVRIDAHSVQGKTMCHGRDDQPPGILEADEAAIKQVIDCRRQEQSIFTIKTLFVIRIAPGFAMTCTQMGRIVHFALYGSGFRPASHAVCKDLDPGER